MNKIFYKIKNEYAFDNQKKIVSQIRYAGVVNYGRCDYAGYSLRTTKTPRIFALIKDLDKAKIPYEISYHSDFVLIKSPDHLGIPRPEGSGLISP